MINMHKLKPTNPIKAIKKPILKYNNKNNSAMPSMSLYTLNPKNTPTLRQLTGKITSENNFA